MSNLATTTQVDTYSKNDDDTPYMETSGNHYQRTTEITETTTTTNLVWTNFHSNLFQIISSTSTTSLKLPPSGKEYICFQSDVKYSHAAQCTKSRVLTKVISLILEIESFEKMCHS